MVSVSKEVYTLESTKKIHFDGVLGSGERARLIATWPGVHFLEGESTCDDSGESYTFLRENRNQLSRGMKDSRQTTSPRESASRSCNLSEN